MNNKPVRTVDYYLGMINSQIMSSIDKTEWAEYEKLIDDFMLLIGKIVNQTISPNRSNIVRNTYKMLYKIALKLLQCNQYKMSSDLLYRALKIYKERKRDNEPHDLISEVFGDMIICDYSKALYNEIGYVRVYGTYDIIRSLTQLEFLVDLHFHFLILLNQKVFDQLVSFFTSCIIENVKLSKQENELVLTNSVLELYRITQHDLSDTRKFSDGRKKEEVLNYYVLEWSEIIRSLYKHDKYSTIEMIFSHVGSSVMGITTVIDTFFPSIAHIFIMMLSMDRDHELEYIGKFADIPVPQKYTSTTNISTYVLRASKQSMKEILKNSYSAFAILSDRRQIPKASLSSFDNSPEVYLVFFNIFEIDPEFYSDTISWIMELSRFDSFQNILPQIKSALGYYYNGLRNSMMLDVLKTLTIVFPSFQNKLQDNRKLLDNLNILEMIAERMIYVSARVPKADADLDAVYHSKLSLFGLLWYYAYNNEPEKMLSKLKEAIRVDVNMLGVILKDSHFYKYHDNPDFKRLVDRDLV